MAFNERMVEEIGLWCLHTRHMADDRSEARRLFFGEDNPRPVKYWPGANEGVNRSRRFMGWFMFDYTLPDGGKPAEAAVRQLYSGGTQVEALRAVAGARFMMAIVSSVIGRNVYLELEEETFEVRSRVWAANMAGERGQAVLAHIVPVHRGYWLPGPGWLVWPFTLGPGLRTSLKQFQMDSILVERCLQDRVESEGRSPRSAPPRDNTLAEAVARMTTWAEENGYTGLVMPAEDWQALVLKHIASLETIGYLKEALARAGDLKSQDNLQTFMDLSTNIWNNTPQPDRGGKSANQLL